MLELQEYIKACFGVMQADELETISTFFNLTTLKKGDTFLHAGRSCQKLAFVQSGYLRISATTEDREVTQWISVKGNFVTDLSSFIFEGPARWTIQALTDCEVYIINKEKYKEIGEVVSSWPELEKLFLVRCFVILENRIYSHLSMTAEERYRFFYEHNRELFNQVPLQYIASMLGMTPETFSRIRRKELPSRPGV